MEQNHGMSTARDAHYGRAAVPDINQPPLSRSIAMVSSARERLDQVVSTLEKRLEPVMGVPSPSPAETGLKPVIGPRFSDTLAEESERLHAMINRIEKVIERLEF